MMDQPKFIRTDADGFSHISEPAILVLEISRGEIESCNYTSALERLMVMADSRESTLRYRESLILQVTGYDTDPRELPEIADVREFFSCLVHEWPHWFWFLNRELGTTSLFMSLICKVTIHRGNGSFGVEFSDPNEMHDKLADLLERGIALFEAFDISEADAEASALSAIASLGLDSA